MVRVTVDQLPLFTKIITYIPYFIALAFSYFRESLSNVIAVFTGTAEGREIQEYGPLVKSLYFALFLIGITTDMRRFQLLL